MYARKCKPHLVGRRAVYLNEGEPPSAELELKRSLVKGFRAMGKYVILTAINAILAATLTTQLTESLQRWRLDAVPS